MRSQVLDDSNFVKHDDLGDEGEGLKPQRVTPGEFPRRPAGWANAGEHKGGWQEHHEVRERVGKRVIRHLEWALDSHQVNDECRARDEEDLHACVVQRDEVHEEIHIAKAEHNQIDFEGFAG